MQHEYSTPGVDCQAPIDTQAPIEQRESLGQLVELERLHDKRANGTERPWSKHHKGTLALAALYDYMATRGEGEGVIDPAAGKWLERSAALMTCAPWAEFERLSDGRLRLHNATFCRVRLCPMCQWRRSLKLGAQARRVVEAVTEQKKVRWLMLTVTVKNIPAAELGETVTHLHQSLTRLTHKKAWPAIGWLRATEVTYNAQKDTYHPHMHLLLCVNPSYFKGSAYISKSKWIKIWRDAARLDYDPSVDIHTVKARGKIEGMGGAVAEVSKYGAKPADYLRPWDIDTSCKVIATLDAWLDGRRLTAWGGVCKDAAAALKLSDIDTGDLVHVDEDDVAEVASDEDEAALIGQFIAYRWSVGFGDYAKADEWQAPQGWRQRARAYKVRRETAQKRAEQEAAYTMEIADIAATDRLVHGGRNVLKVSRVKAFSTWRPKDQEQES